MSNFDQYEDVEFSENPDPRVPMVIILDCSSSMLEKRPGDDTNPMLALDSALDVLVSEIHKDPLAKRRVELSFVTFGTEVNPATEFATVENVILPSLDPMGTTSMGGAVLEAVNAVEERKKTYKTNGVQYYRPIVMLISDGLATDSIEEAVQKVRTAEGRKGLTFFAVGIEGADLDQLSKFSTRGALKLKGINFGELFQWLSASAASVSASQPGDKVALPNPSAWAELES